MGIDKNIVLVIGNGFDLNLGLDTSYDSFFHSSFWPFKKIRGGLGEWLNKKATQEKWYDLEYMLKEYACSDNQKFIYNPELDKKQFNLLKAKIGEFLMMAERKEIIRNSIAANLLWWFDAYWRNTHVYTFNYTNFQRILTDIGNDKHVNYSHVHGSLSSHTQILGIDDSVNIREGYEFLIKPNQPQYSSQSLIQDLDKADCVIFFGLSMGDIDMPYFKDFFIRRSTENFSGFEKKFIYIFTKDSRGEESIRKNLRILGNNTLMRLHSFNVMEFFYTQNNNTWYSDERIDEYFNHKLHLRLNLI